MRNNRKFFFVRKKGQVGIESMILIGFVTFVIISVFGLSVFYSGQVKDQIRSNQVENFAVQLIHSAESVFFAGEPSRVSVNLYLPEGVTDIEVNSTYLIVSTHLNSGENRRGYVSRVPLSGVISSTPGTKKLSLRATSDCVLIE